MLTRVGFLFSVESLLSTYGTELGMLGDTEAAVKELARVQLKLRPVKSLRAAAFRVSITAGPASIVIELPIITRCAIDFLDRCMNRIPDQDTRSGGHLPRARDARGAPAGHKPIPVVPVLFSQGVNEMQIVANTVERDALQKDINAENVLALEAYVKALAAWGVKKQVRDGTLWRSYDVVSRHETRTTSPTDDSTDDR
ncbi:hypothetical protein PsorP6_017477 [Peronosclerospora sorghi]|uniref:Uncharacterized protein n=1 Tax=Peronosclerospora sorghi TaxID=230839 RepID=A0ACC0WN47_9STRA|nr:hypothetical protein PsorP6_017477 [Peronosclerospora sorghi]